MLMTAKSERRSAGGLEFLTFVLLMVFFIGIALIDGPVWCVDSNSYVGMEFSREPVYPLFLMGLRTFFERLGVTAEPYALPAYLTMAVVLQSILWAVAIFRLGIYIFDVTKNVLAERKAKLLMILAVFFQVAVACLNRFMSKRGSMYSESIMTESLAMPLFVLFTILLLKSFEDYSIGNCIKLFLLATLICSVRKQMLIVVLMWGFCSFILHLFVKRYRSLKKFSYTVIFVVFTIVAVALFDRGYNQAIRGVFAPHTGNNTGGLCTVLYSSDLDDAWMFDEEKELPELKDLYIKIMTMCNEQELTFPYAPEGDWEAMASHYADGYDIIGYEIVIPVCEEYVKEHFPGLDDVQIRLMEDKVEGKLFKTLLKGQFVRTFKGEEKELPYVFSANVAKAFVASVARNTSSTLVSELLLLIYAVYVALYILFAVRRGNESILLLGFVVMTGLAINAFVTGALIFPQPRYMTYSMGLFYLSMSTLILGRR